MAVTPLTFYAWNYTGLPQLGNEAGLTPTQGTTTFIYPTSLVGTATGYGEVCGHTNANNWPALDAMGPVSGNGFWWGVSGAYAALLDKQEIVAGVWSALFYPATSVGGTTLTADLYTRVFIARAGATQDSPFFFEPVGILVALGQTITSSSTPATFTGPAFPALQLNTGDRLYCDIWANITGNTAGNGALALNIALASTNTTGSASAAWTTPGYQPLTLPQLANDYRYGAFSLNDGVYSVQAKDFAFPTVTPALYKIARHEGMKKTGETVGEVKIPVTVRVIATSRADLEAKLDALYGALALRQQQLTLHAADGRYWVADAVAGKASLVPGKLISVEVPITFLAAQPYALAATQSSFFSGTQAPTNNGDGTFTYSLPEVFGGGTIYSYPTLVLNNLSSSDSLTLNVALTNGNLYTSITVNSLTNALKVGDTLLLTSGANTQTVVVSTATAASGSPVAIPVTSFTANFSYPATTTTVVKQTQFTQVKIVQVTDGQTLTIAGLTLNPNDYLTIVCDPAASNGYTAIQNSNNIPLPFSGVFPVMEPGPTQWNVIVSSPSNPSFSVSWTWTSRFLS